MTPLESEILRHWHLYLEGRPEVPDATFDALVDQLRRRQPESSVLSFLGSKGSCPHDKPMLSLQKVKSSEAIEKWIAGIKTQDLLVMPKFDGLAVSLKFVSGQFVRATTRGDGRFGENITRHALRMASVPRVIQGFDGEVRGEIVLLATDFPGVARRNVAVGLVGREDTKDSHHLKFIPWGVVGGQFRTFSDVMHFLQTHFHRVPWVLPYAWADAVDLITMESDIDRDGAVIVVNDLSLRERLGENDHHPRWAVALKLATATATTTVRGVEWQVGRTGVVTPVVLIDEVEVDGANITRVTGHNAATLTEKGIGVGAVVSIMRRGGVIPHIEEVVLEAYVELPSICPECGRSLTTENRVLTHDRRVCPAAQRAALEFFLKTIGVDGFGDTTLRAIGAKTLLEPRLTEACQKVRSVSLETALEAVGVPLAKKIATAIDQWRELLTVSDEFLLDIEGLGPTQLAKIRDTDLTLLEQLEEVGVEIKRRVRPAEGPLNGEVVCFTGELRTLGRDGAQNLAKQKGALVTSSVTRKTTILVAAGESGSTKYQKALAQGVKIITEEEFLARVGPITAPRNVVEFGRQR